MKILFINSVCGIRSTGRICTDLAEVLQQAGHEVKIAYGRESVPEKYQPFAVRIGTETQVKLHAVQSRLLDNDGFTGRKATKAFIRWVKSYNPDIIHLHNLHGYYLNVEVLFEYLKTCGKPIFWTLHDCWAFTGHCAYYSTADCEKWQTHCHQCPQKLAYPKSILLDRSYHNFQKKRRLFTNCKNMTLITPSQWLKNQVQQSFLREYPVYTIPNGINLGVFKPTPSDLRQQFHLESKKVILGVASAWDTRKGLDDFIRLSSLLDDRYKIVLIGLSKTQRQAMPLKILCLSETGDMKALARWYTLAHAFVNPSVEETMGLTTAEALACGTPVITYNKTAVPEVADETCGIAVNCRPEEIARALSHLPQNPEACILRARAFEKQAQYQKYLRLYEGQLP